METLLLNKEEVGRLISMDDVIVAVEDAYKAYSSGQVVQPGYMALHMPAPRGEIDFKPGYHKTSEVISIKASSGGFYENVAEYGLPANMGTILLFDARTCALICVMDGSLITGLRTGAAGAVSVKQLARKNAKVLSSIGTGNQARMQARAISRVMEIERIYAYDDSIEAMSAYKADVEVELNIPVVLAKTKQEAVEHADILATTTRGKGSLVESGWVKPGTHIIAIGTDVRGKQEHDPRVFKNAKIVNDSIEQCTAKGETWHPLNEGIITQGDIYGEIGEILLGKKAGRENDEEITIFDSTGMAIQDNTTSYKIYQNAIARGVGTRYAFFK